jgi:hypothetical protein
MTRPKLNIFRNREFPHQVELPADSGHGLPPTTKMAA